MEELKNIPVQYNEDDRAQRCLNVFEEMGGQINVSYVNSTKHIVAWHVHEKQTDYWFCVKGSFKVGLAIPQDGYPNYKVEWHYLSDKEQKVLKIPPGVFHGYKAIEPNSIMLYGLTHKYDPNDEEKALPGAFNESWETEDK
jgi:dTDP-4-dehydrorhamnose 3,5-epimerase